MADALVKTAGLTEVPVWVPDPPPPGPSPDPPGPSPGSPPDPPDPPPLHYQYFLGFQWVTCTPAPNGMARASLLWVDEEHDTFKVIIPCSVSSWITSG